MAMKLMLDAMGGDQAPAAQIDGALLAAEVLSDEIVLVGDVAVVECFLKKKKKVPKNVSILHAPEIIKMDDEPSTAYRQKKNSSLLVAINHVAKGHADAVISAGNSGAVMTAALLDIKRIEGISRPALATLFPTVKGNAVILDIGANVDSKPVNLLQFAIMGRIYAKEVMGIETPRVGLLSIGEEKNKGNELTLSAFELLKKNAEGFIGNMEGRDIPLGKADVVVCDGFIGNILLKFGEGVGEMLFKLIKGSLKKHPVTFLAIPFLWAAIKDIRKRADYSEYGAAPLLGVKGSCFICHGRSNAKAIKNALIKAATYVERNTTGKIEQSVINPPLSLIENDKKNRC